MGRDRFFWIEIKWIILESRDYFWNSTSVQTFSFCQASNEQIAIKLVDALNETHNTDLFPELGKFPLIIFNRGLQLISSSKLFR